MLNIRFPYQFEEAYSKKYGNQTKYFGNGVAPTIHISYALADNDIRRKNQMFHNEQMVATRNHTLATIKSKADFQRKYPYYPTPAPCPLPNKNITSGSRAPLDSVSQSGFPSSGSLSTFKQHEYGSGLSGGVLKNYEYARHILDRRANQIRQRADPAFIPATQPISREEQQKLDLSSLLGEVGDAITAGVFSDLVYSATRKLVGAFIRTIPLIDDEEDIAQIKRVIDNVLRKAEVSDAPGAHRAPIGVFQEELRPAMEARRLRIRAVLEKLENFLALYMEVFRRGTMTEADRITAAKSFAKRVGLFKFADFSTELGLEPVGEPEGQQSAELPPDEGQQPPDEGGDDEDEEEEEEEEEEPEEEEESDESVAPSETSPTSSAERAAMRRRFPEPRRDDDGNVIREPSSSSSSSSTAEPHYAVITKNNKRVKVPTNMAGLDALSFPQLKQLANDIKRSNKTFGNHRPKYYKQYIIERLAGDVGIRL